MKIRSPTFAKWIGLLGAVIIRAWIGTLSYRFYHLGPVLDPTRLQTKDRYIYVAWHENILVPCYEFAGVGIQVLISQHHDGEMIAQLCQRIGFGTIRGSSTRGGLKAMREMIRASEGAHIAVAPDGPRGPRRQMELGFVYLAAKTGLPIVLLGIGHNRPWRLNTWDRFALPRPFSKAVIVSTKPITIPADVNREELEAYRANLERRLSELTDYAERLAMR